jgi:hypothetical protein
MPFILGALCFLAALLSRIGLRAGRPSLGGRRSVCGSRKRFCSSVGVGCPSFGGQRALSRRSNRHSSTLVPATNRKKSKLCVPWRSLLSCCCARLHHQTLEQRKRPRISAMATVLKTVSAMGTRP